MGFDARNAISPEISKRSEVITPEIRRTELGHAFGFRTKLADATQQIELTNKLREQGLIAVLEGHDTILGFFSSKKQFSEFAKALSGYEGTVGFGATHGNFQDNLFGDSQISLIIDPLTGAKDVVVTCEATNGAARAQKSMGLMVENQNLSRHTDSLYAYRYSLEHDPQKIEALVASGEMVLGDKGTPLERISIMEALPEFDGEAAELPREFLEHLDELDTRETLSDVTELSVLSIDVNGFSKAIHAKTLLWLQALKEGKPAEEVQALRNEANAYLVEIATFFTTLEYKTREQILVAHPDLTEEKVMEVIGAVATRGDAGGVIVPMTYRKYLPEALIATLKIMPKLSVKAVLQNHRSLTTVARNGKHSTPDIVDTVEAEVVDVVKQRGLGGMGKSVIADYDENVVGEYLVDTDGNGFYTHTPKAIRT